MRLLNLVLIFIICIVFADLQAQINRMRISLNKDWRFQKGDPDGTADKLAYKNIKNWITRTENEFLKVPAVASQDAGNPGEEVIYTHPGFDDKS